MKRRGKKRKNPAGKWIALGVGTAAALGLAGYGIYRWRKSKDEGAMGSGDWTFRLIPQPTAGGGQPLWLAQVVGPMGQVQNLGPFGNQTAAATAAQGYIASQGGTAVMG